jgi:hypothetical protein
MKLLTMIRHLYSRLHGPPVKIGQFGRWESQGVIQWEDSRRIVWVEFYYGKWYAWVDGSMTAIPADEIILD